LSLNQTHKCPDCGRVTTYYAVNEVIQSTPCTDCQLIRIGRGDEVKKRKEGDASED